jgi:hypothetical protein
MVKAHIVTALADLLSSKVQAEVFPLKRDLLHSTKAISVLL